MGKTKEPSHSVENSQLLCQRNSLSVLEIKNGASTIQLEKQKHILILNDLEKKILVKKWTPSKKGRIYHRLFHERNYFFWEMNLTRSK